MAKKTAPTEISLGVPDDGATPLPPAARPARAVQPQETAVDGYGVGADPIEREQAKSWKEQSLAYQAALDRYRTAKVRGASRKELQPLEQEVKEVNEKLYDKRQEVESRSENRR